MDTETGALSSIFINYRRGDSRVYADMLYTWLSERYGEEQVFKDVDTIEIGLDFDEAIERVVAASDVMLVVIGGDWVTDQSGRRRLEDPEDYVRKEIEAGSRGTSASFRSSSRARPPRPAHGPHPPAGVRAERDAAPLGPGRAAAAVSTG